MTKAPRKSSSAPSPVASNVQVSRAPDFRSTYANFAQVNFTPFEVTISLGEATQELGTLNPAVQIEMKTRIMLGPLEAKLLLTMLHSTIKKFEEKYGAIVVPEDVKLQGVSTEGD